MVVAVKPLHPQNHFQFNYALLLTFAPRDKKGTSSVGLI